MQWPQETIATYGLDAQKLKKASAPHVNVELHIRRRRA